MPASQVRSTSISDLRSSPKETLIYDLEKISIKSAIHKTAAKEVASVLLSIVQIEFTAQLEPSLIQPSYSNNPRAFVIQLPTQLAESAKKLAASFGFHAIENGCKYLLKLNKNAVLTPQNSVSLDSTFHYFWITLPHGYNSSDTITQEEIAKHISKAGLYVKKFYHQTDREAGTLTARCRTEFDLTDQFNVFMLRHILFAPLPGGFNVKLGFSAYFCTTYKLHRDCLRFLRQPGCPKEAQDADICACISNVKKQTRPRDTHERQEAQKAFHERMKNRRLNPEDF